MDTEQIMTQMLVQGSEYVAIKMGEVPVICESERLGGASALGMAVNFLRSGAPAVQLTAGSWIEVSRVRDRLETLQLPGEQFDVDVGEALDEDRPQVVTLTRIKRAVPDTKD